MAQIDAAVDRAREAGGQVLAEPLDVGEQRRMAWVQDPSAPRSGSGGPGRSRARANEHGTNIWNELVTADGDRATPFCDKVLGGSRC